LKAAVAAEVSSMGNAPGALGLLLAGRYMALWGDWPATESGESEAAYAPVINPRLLRAVRDLRDPDPKTGAAEIQAWGETLVLAARTSAQAFADSARDLGDATLDRLFNYPRYYRGRVIHAGGRLLQVVRREPPAPARRRGVKNLFEVLLAAPTLDRQLLAVVVTELPSGVRPGRGQSLWAELDGYFFKKQLSGVRRELTVAPLLVGRTLLIPTARPVADVLQGVKDNTPLPTIEDRVEEFWAMSQVIAQAGGAAPHALANSARPNKGVGRAELLRDPARFRGRVVPLRGALRRVRRVELPENLKVQGLTALYEGWVTEPSAPNDPWCVLFTALPPHVRVGGELRKQAVVSGYFFKALRYRARNQDRTAPLLIGRSVDVEEPAKIPAMGRLLAGVRDQSPLPTPETNAEEYWGLGQALVVASRLPAGALRDAARHQGAVGFNELMGQPDKYRGRVIHLEGRLRHLERQGPAPLVRAEGVKAVYQGLLFDHGPGATPVAVLLSTLPTRVKPGDRVDYPVAVDGFFFKKLLRAGKRELGLMPLVVAGAVALQPGGAAAVPPKGKKASEQAPPIDDLLSGIRDQTRIASPRSNIEEFWGYCETILRASKTSARAFAAAGEKYRYVQWTQLMNDPGRYRGKVIRVRGALALVRRYDPPEYLRARGIKAVYEGWIFSLPRGSNPWCVLFTDLPKHVPVGEDLDYPVTFDGYFFKKYRYTAQKDDRYTALLIGRTLAVATPGAGRSLAGRFSTAFVAGMTALVAGMIFLLVALSWWFRRGDRRLQSRLARKQEEPVFHDEPVQGPDSPQPPADPEVRPSGH
jgi:hypothetical protein